MMTDSFSIRAIFVVIGGLAIFAASAVGAYADRQLRIGAGYKAKIACSEAYVAGRAPDEIEAVEFNNIADELNLVHLRFDDASRTVNAGGPLGLGRARAVFREGYGCTLVNGGRIAPLPELTAAPQETSEAPWPQAIGLNDPRLDRAKLEDAADAIFATEDLETRALIVLVDGKLALERYGPGFDAQTPMLSWSMAKSIIATLVGAGVERGLIDIDDPAPVPEWADRSDRDDISWDALLRMHSGLEFDENYAARTDVTRALFESPDAGYIAAIAPHAHPVGDVW